MSNDKMRQEKIELLRMLREAGYPATEAVEAIGTYGTTASVSQKATTAMEEPVIEVSERIERSSTFARKTVTIREWLDEQKLDMPVHLIQRVGQSCSYRMKKSTNGCYVPKTRDDQTLYPRTIIKQAVREIAGVPLLGGKEWAK